MKIAQSIIELVGNTPLLKINRYQKEHQLSSNLYLKLESFNPASSVKDRIAKNMILSALKAGKITPNTTVVEPTSGNTGIGLAFVCASLGIKVLLTMPETMSVERRQLLSAFGAQLVLTEGKLGMKGAIAKAQELLQTIPKAFMPSQFSNPANPEIHYLTTGPEIWKDTHGQIDILVAGVGTGGTITGAGQYLKEQNPKIKIVAVEPLDSPVLTKGEAGPHKIQGIGAGFVPDVLDVKIYDEIVMVASADAAKTAKQLAVTEGVLCGISSGAALYAATELALRPENKNKNIVVMMPDTGERYLSTDLFV